MMFSFIVWIRHSSSRICWFISFFLFLNLSGGPPTTQHDISAVINSIGRGFSCRRAKVKLVLWEETDPVRKAVVWRIPMWKVKPPVFCSKPMYLLQPFYLGSECSWLESTDIHTRGARSEDWTTRNVRRIPAMAFVQERRRVCVCVCASGDTCR